MHESFIVSPVFVYSIFKRVVGTSISNLTNKRITNVIVELTPAAYLALCGLVRDALEVDSDAKFLLENVADELMGAMAGGMISSELAAQPAHLDALRRGGFLAG